MKESEIKPAIAKLDKELDALNKEGDVIKTKARALSQQRASLQSMIKMVDLPPSPIREQILSAVGIESGEKVMTGKK